MTPRCEIWLIALLGRAGADGTQIGKLSPSAFHDESDPHGCAFDAEGRLFTGETGRKLFGGADGHASS